LMKKRDKLSFTKAACLPVAGLSTSLLLAKHAGLG